jgi:hypothetical protein
MNTGPDRYRNNCPPNCGCRCGDRNALPAATAPSQRIPCLCAMKPRPAPIPHPAPTPSRRGAAGPNDRNDTSPIRIFRPRPMSNRRHCRPNDPRYRDASRLMFPLHAVAKRNRNHSFLATRRRDRVSRKTFRTSPWNYYPLAFQFFRQSPAGSGS